jgi:hypothetical protein
MYHDHYQVCNVSSCAYRFDILHWGYFGYILKSLNSFGLYDRILYGECFSSGTLINIRNSNRRQMSKTQWVQHFIVSSILLCPAYYWVQHITVSSILLSTTHYCVQHITVYNTLLCPAYYCVQHIIVSSILLCTTHYCVQHITVYNTLLCPAYYCVQHIIVSSILLSTTHYCVQHITVYNTLLCPAYYCVQHIIVSSILMCQENIMSTFLHMSLLINFSFMILKFSLFSVKYYHKRWVQG